MLYIHYTLSDGNGMREREWHVGETPPANGDLDEASIQVQSVYADGHELEYIHAYFDNLPRVTHVRSNVWRGEMARFIFDNLDKRLPPSLIK